MSLILDAGALVAIERGDRDTIALLKREVGSRRHPITHGGVIGQVWRGGGGRQARLAQLLDAVEVVPLDDTLGRRAGVLLKQAKETDVIDAAVVLLCVDGDWILTSDPDDLRPLARAAGLHVDVIPV